ncbi:hypothetical protein [Phytopseudomonas daroniae]|uniref:hypothetical protein n=1 Tax=Phytopseudomonas daroniae TaxID=2487519 RepID=UPI0010385D9D|nr:hypothetical protein [Pseudomonas daroniae]TBU75227.1 hypothetical protein DNK10_11270 [Pseudomonas daroniae]
MSTPVADYSSIITAKMLAQRLGTVASDLKPDGSAVPLYIRINGQRHELTIDNFQVDDDGSLLFSPDLLLNIERNTSWTSVLAERIRQVHTYGFLHEEDDHFTSGELAAASLSYLEQAFCQVNEPGTELLEELIPNEWPWPDEAWKPSTAPRRNLVKALALGLAELERLDRKAVAEDSAHD